MSVDRIRRGLDGAVERDPGLADQPDPKRRRRLRTARQLAMRGKDPFAGGVANARPAFSARSTVAGANPDSSAMSLTVGPFQFSTAGSGMPPASPVDAFCIIVAGFNARNNQVYCRSRA